MGPTRASDPGRRGSGASGGAAGAYFGLSVALSGTTAVVGAPFQNNFTGAAYVEALPSQQAELTASDGAADDIFGYSVAIAGTRAVVGAYGHNGNAGAAYVFVQSGTAWTQAAELTASGGAAGAYFGLSVALSGTTAVVGAPFQNNFTGAAYVFSNA